MKPNVFFSVLAGAAVMLLAFLHVAFIPSGPDAGVIKITPNGRQPALAISHKGEIQVVYGAEDKIYYASSPDRGLTFSSPQLVAHLPGLHLGMTRGPRIAATADYTVVTAINTQGNVYAYQLNPKTRQWSAPVQVNDADTVAKEGFVAVTGGSGNTVHAIWLDLRGQPQNKIYGAVSENGGKTWSRNRQLYQSPDGTVCECCRPSLTADANGRVSVMFRNWLQGSRDLYLLTSANGGASFGKAQKMGLGTWPLKGCPMDGGDIGLDSRGNAVTVWRREKDIFFSEPGKAEVRLGEGRTPTVAPTLRGPIVAWQQSGEIVVRDPSQGNLQSLGKGAYPQLAASPKKDFAVCVWEADGQIMFKKIF